MNVSRCCHREIVVGRKMEYPLGGSTWGETLKVDVCSGCGKEIECDPVECCDNCGEPAGKLVETRFGGYCEPCVHENAEDLMERVG